LLTGGGALPPAIAGVFGGLRPGAGAPATSGGTPSPEAAALASALAIARNNPGALVALQQAFGPALPADNKYTPSVSVAGVQAQTATYDEAHDGRFSVPGGQGTVSMADVLARPDPAWFIATKLSSGTKSPPGVFTVFVPGLNTPEAESERRLQNQYSPVLGDRKMAHLHLGSDTDQGPLEFAVDQSLVGPLRSPALAAAGLAPELRQEGGQAFAKFYAGQRDRIEATLVSAGLIETQLMRSVKDLLEARLEGPGGPGKLELLLYSRGSIDGAAAISGWIDEYVGRHGGEVGPTQARKDAVALLRNNVLVETYGNASQQFPDGPRYMHWSADNDPLTKDVGSTASRPNGGGKDAVYLHYDGVFQGFDAHNLGAVGAAAAKLYLELNGVESSAALYEKARSGAALVRPTTAQIKARIVETGGQNWLWTPEVAMNGVSL
jgi:hypothetical protein